MLRRRVARKFRSLPWMSRSQHDLAAKSCPAHNFVIWSRISKIFHSNDHHIETTCRAQHLGRYLEGQCQSMTLQQNLVRPITLFEVGFRKYFTEMITILRWRVGRNIWADTLKVKVTAWPCSKIVSGRMTLQQNSVRLIPLLFEVIWSRISKIFHRNDHHIEMTCRAQHFGLLPWRPRSQQDLIILVQQNRVRSITLFFEVGFCNYFWQTTSLTVCPIPIRGALPGFDRLLLLHNF